MGYTRLYTLTVREVLRNLSVLAIAYEKMCAGSSPTGNYHFALDAAATAATLKASQQLILQVPAWISVGERLPEDGVVVLAWNGKRVVFGYARDGEWIDTLYGWVIPNGPTHWMPLPEPPEVK